jgi:putative inorganic carbon (hco3(-)) transporter
MQSSTITWNAWVDGRLPLAIGVLGAILAASLFYTPIPFVLLVGILAFFYFISRPYELLLLMVFLIPFNFVFRIGSIPVAAELLKVLAWIPFLVYLSSRKQAFKTSRYNWCFAVLAGLLFLSIFRSTDLPFTVTQSVRLASNIGLCYLVVNLVDSGEKVFQIFRVLIISALLVACYGLYQFVIQDFGMFFWIVNPRLDTSLSHGRDTFWEWRNRITSVLTSEMELGHYFNLCLPVGVVLWMTEGRKRINAKWFLVVIAMLAGLLLTFTFGAWLSMVATIGFFILIFDKKGRWKTALITAVALFLVAAFLVFGPLRPFMEAKVFGAGIGGLAWDVSTRMEIWLLALDTWRSHPVIGIGYGNFPSVTVGALQWLSNEWVSSGTSPHNIYLFILAELGLVGFAAIVFIFVRTVRTNLRLLSAPGLGHIALTLAFALTTALFGGCSDDSALYGPHTSYLVWLFIGMSEAVFNLAAPLSEPLGLRADE